jgi:lipopolysaccharide transport system ATP-binding protein
LDRGECLGLIGHNGAGKTTLLKMLNGLIKPDCGRIELRGRVGGLIALGAGFNPLLSGRENIYVNASVLGLSTEDIDGKMEEIVDFAELHEFIDAPVQNYSSGMYVRLGFAIAAVMIKPDILLLDEILAVGDVAFAIKCLNAVKRISADAAVILVSHNMQFISSFCTRVMVLDHSRCLLDTDEPGKAIDFYYSMIDLQQRESGTGEAKVVSVNLKDDDLVPGEPTVVQGTAATVLVRIRVQSRGAYLKVFIHDQVTSPVMCIPVLDEEGNNILFDAGEFEVELPLGNVDLTAGKYFFVVTLREARTSIILARAEGMCPFRVTADEYHWGKIVRPAKARVTKRIGIQ